MIITKEQQEALIQNYANKGKNNDEYFAFIEGLTAAIDLVVKLDKSQQKKYTIEEVKRCAEHWGVCKVEKEYIEKFLNQTI